MERVTALLTGKAAAYAGGAAVAGGIGRWIVDGDYRMATLAQKIVSGVVGWCTIVSVSVVFPAVIDHEWGFAALCFLSGFLVEPVLKMIFWRLENLDVSLNLGTAKIESEGRDKHESD